MKRREFLNKTALSAAVLTVANYTFSNKI